MNESTTRKLEQYALLSQGLSMPLPKTVTSLTLGASFLTVLPAAAVAQSICTVNVNQTIDDGAGPYHFDFDQDGIDEFYLRAGGASSNVFFRFPTANVGFYAGYGRPSRLSAGFTLSSGLPGLSNVTTAFLTRTTYGYWLNLANTAGEAALNGYVGFTFRDFSGDDHLGWIELTVQDSNPGPAQATIIRYGYNLTPIGSPGGDTIQMGQTSPVGSCPPPLPVELTAFDAVADGSRATLSWITATQTDNAGFEVERSDDRTAFEKIAFVEGAGTTTEARTYTYADETVRPGRTYFYRLKQIDYDGQFDYSPVVELEIPPLGFSLGEIYPNPLASGPARLRLTTEREHQADLVVYDVRGQEIRRTRHALQPGENELQVDVGSLSAGVYFVKVEADRRSYYRKLIVE